jgi:hypothetical protein
VHHICAPHRLTNSPDGTFQLRLRGAITTGGEGTLRDASSCAQMAIGSGQHINKRAR